MDKRESAQQGKRGDNEEVILMNANRRTFIKGFTALAALAIAPVIFKPLVQTDYDKFLEMAKSGGVIDGYLFDLRKTGTLVLRDFHDLRIQNCTFLFSGDVSMVEQHPETCSNVRVRFCSFHAAFFLKFSKQLSECRLISSAVI